MTVYVSTMILRSMRMTGEKARGATLTTAEQTETLAELNTFMDSCAADRLLCYQVLQENFSLSTSTVSYTIGSGATFNTTRPTKIVDPCFIRDSSSLDSPLKLLGAAEYGRIVQKSVGFTYPSYLFYDQAFDANGYGKIFVYPAPSASLTLYINSWKQLGTFAALSTAVLLPPGYQLFVESNFAVHLAAGQTPISPELAKIARDSKAMVKNLNLPDTIARLDAGIVGVRRSGTNIFTGP